ncbi:MAG: MgtC/SapB family protein [Thermoproteota archaeon]|nr:MgtC/SapB family protein [Thermoproteota archaeon]
MVFENIPTGYEQRFLMDIAIALAAGFAIGAERESRGKPAGIVHTALSLAVQQYSHSCLQ